MDIPFEVGGTYRNRQGPYEVIELTPPTMVIRYRDGRELRSPIADQARIWENIQIEADDPTATDDDIEDSPRQRRTISAPRPARQVPRPAFDFDGLVESDFRNTPTGTHWRRRGSLGGLLAGHLSTRSGRRFESQAVSRRCEVHVFEPHRFNATTPLREAKFLFRVDESGVLHGFYIEKNNGPMDATWDWTRLSTTMARDPDFCARLAHTLIEHDLHWQLDLSIPGHSEWPTITVSAAPDGQAHWRSGDEAPQAMSWAEFTTRLQTLPAEQWCNLMVCHALPREQAIALRVGVADQVAKVWHALLPLYLASVQTVSA